MANIIKMNTLSALIFLWIYVISVVNSLASSKELLLISVATDETDGYLRFVRSLSVYGINSKILGLGQPWTGGDVAQTVGGGMKINLLREEMEKHKSKEDLVVMFTDSYDVILTAGKEEILKAFENLQARVVFGAEDFCWPDKSLKTEYPKVRHGYKYLNSGGFIGYAPQIYEIISHKKVADDYDDQLYYTNIFLDPSLRSHLYIKLDTQAKIFQNLNGVGEDVGLEFEEKDTRLTNTVYKTTPIVIHGNGDSKILLNSLGNYLAKSWTVSEGCLACAQGAINLVEESDYPSVMMGIFIQKPTPFLEEMLEKAANISYVRRKISLFIHNMMKEHDSLVESWVKDQKESKRFDFIKYIPSSDHIKEWHARNLAIDKCLDSSCDVYFNLDSDVHIDNPEALKLLVSYNRPVIAAIITRIGKAWSTFWGAVTESGFYARSTDYMEIVHNNRRGIWNVPHISGAYAIRRSVLESAKPNYIHKLLDADMALTLNMRNQYTFMYAVNLEGYGHLVDNDAVSTAQLHNDLWQVATNPEDWEARYLHPKYYDSVSLKVLNEMPCPDVYWFPLFTPRFCKEFIETMEASDKWSTGKNEDPRLTGGYENVPTVDIHMNQVAYDQEWLFILKTYIKPLAEKVYIGYNSDARSHMNFIVRYKPSEQSFLRPHHDSSTYTINVALNNVDEDYEGGGSNFIRYNCSVSDTRLGWTIMHPGRLTHYHEGLQTTKGTRYIMISFIDP